MELRHSLIYESTDIPAGVSIDEYRRSRPHRSGRFGRWLARSRRRETS